MTVHVNTPADQEQPHCPPQGEAYYLRALEMIVARIQGEWDHPELESWGPLDTDDTKDVLRMANTALVGKPLHRT